MSTYKVLDGNGLGQYVYGLGSGASGDPLRLVSKRYSNALVEDGKIFTFAPRFSLANNAVLNYLIKTPATPKVTIYQIDCSADNAPVMHDLYESTAVSANGTAVTPFNNNRTSATAAATLIYSGPTVTSTGTALISDMVIGGKAAGGQDQGEFRLILAPSTNYLLQITQSSGNATANITFYFKFAETQPWH